jgi:predicted RNA-binding protein with TRAM domain
VFPKKSSTEGHIIIVSEANLGEQLQKRIETVHYVVFAPNLIGRK